MPDCFAVRECPHTPENEFSAMRKGAWRRIGVPEVILNTALSEGVRQRSRGQRFRLMPDCFAVRECPHTPENEFSAMREGA